MTHLQLTKRFFFSAALMLTLAISFLVSSLTAAPASAAENPTQNLTATVIAKGQDNFTIKFGTVQGTLKVVSSTKFLKDGKPATFADLKIGMKVELVVQYYPGAQSYIALQVNMISQTLAPAPVVVYGLVTAKGQDNFTLKIGDHTVTFKVTGETRFFQETHAVTFANLKVGMQIAAVVTYNSSYGKYVALRVYMPKA